MNRKEHRAELLLAIRQREETAARRRFDVARVRAEGIRRRLAELQRLLVGHDQAARKRLTGSTGPQTMAAYRADLAELREAIGRQSAALDEADRALADCRAGLLEAMSRRNAVGLLHQKLLDRRSRSQDLAEAGRVDDMHASRLAWVGQAPAE